MDFVNFAAVEFVGAIEAQRAFERKQGKWLRAWRELERTEPAEITPLVIKADALGQTESGEAAAKRAA